MAARKLRQPILIGGLIAGGLDITYAFVFSYLRSGRNPAFVIRSRKLAMEMNEVRLETERLWLRWFRDDDFDQYKRICADPEVMRFLGDGRPMSELEAWRHMAAIMGHWYFRGYGVWAVEEKTSGKVVGRIGLMFPKGWPGFELGWALGRANWGKGYATEGAQRVMEYAFTEMNRDHVISLIAPANVASIKVAERLGETVEGETELMGHHVLIYGISRDEWRKRREENSQG